MKHLSALEGAYIPITEENWSRLIAGCSILGSLPPGKPRRLAATHRVLVRVTWGTDPKCVAPVCIEQCLSSPLLSMDCSCYNSLPHVLSHWITHLPMRQASIPHQQTWNLRVGVSSSQIRDDGWRPHCVPQSTHEQPRAFLFHNLSGQTGVWRNNSPQGRASQREPCGPLWQFSGHKWARQRKELGLVSVWEAQGRKSKDPSPTVHGEKGKATFHVANSCLRFWKCW